jgi:2-polyprenyl-3-methyl-5-hydroxy-6-metoxy-1,4-benzoquinol methylase
MLQQGYELRQCVQCQHRFCAVAKVVQEHIADVYGDDYFSGGGAGYSDYFAEQETLRARGRGFAQLLAKHGTAPGEMLDVGAAAGFLMQGWADEKWKVHGIEPNAGMAQYGRSKLGLDVRCGDFDSSDFSDLAALDCVAMIQVLPHLLSPAKSISRAAKLLKPGGALLLETWDCQSLAARLLGKAWHEYSPPSVLHWFSIASLRHLAESHGFKYTAHGRTIRWISGRHAKSLLRHLSSKSLAGKVASAAATLVPDALSLPYPGDDLFWMMLQKS